MKESNSCSDVCRYISCCWCVFILVIILLLPSVIYVTRKDVIREFTREEHLRRKYHHFGPQFYESGFAEVLEGMKESGYFPRNHLRSNTLPYISNQTYDPCNNPFEYMCHVGNKVESLQESTEKHNRELIEEIEKKEIATTNFVKACMEFHSIESPKDTIRKVLDSKLVIDQLKIIDSLKSYVDLERVLGELFQHGTRLLVSLTYSSMDEQSPLHADRVVSPIALKRAPRILSGYHCRESNHLEECIVREKKMLTMMLNHFYSETLSMDDAMKLEESFPSYSDDWDGLEVYTSKEFEEIDPIVFRFREYLQKSTDTPLNVEWKNFLVDTEFITQLHKTRHQFSIDKWKNYLKIGMLYQVMLHFRVGGSGMPAELIFKDESAHILTPKLVCIKQYEQLFPFHVCHSIKKTMALDILPVKDLFRRIKSGFDRWLVRESESTLKFKYKELVEQIRIKLRDLKLVVDHCWLFRDENKKKFFNDFEDEILGWMNHRIMKEGEYAEMIYHIFHHRDDNGNQNIMLYRNYRLDRKIRDLAQTFLSWSGWYSPLSNTLVIPSGFIHFALKSLEKDGCIFESYVSHMISHETSHMLWTDLQEQWRSEFASNQLYDVSITLREWNERMKRIANDVKLNRDSTHFNELFADWVAYQVAYESLFIENDPTTPASTIAHLNGRKKKLHEKKCFFSTMFRLWCRDKCMKNHPCDYTRAMMSIRASVAMRSYFEDIYKCKSQIPVIPE